MRGPEWGRQEEGEGEYPQTGEELAETEQGNNLGWGNESWPAKGQGKRSFQGEMGEGNSQDRAKKDQQAGRQTEGADPRERVGGSCG